MPSPKNRVRFVISVPDTLQLIVTVNGAMPRWGVTAKKPLGATQTGGLGVADGFGVGPTKEGGGGGFVQSTKPN